MKRFRILICVYFIDIGVGLRTTLQRRMMTVGVESGERKKTADRMAKYILNSKSDNTNKKYFSNFKRFDSFCKLKGYCSKPANDIHVAMYLTYLLDESVSYSVISAAYYSIKWVHTMNDFRDPTESGFVKHLIGAAKRLRSTPIKKKDIIDNDMLKHLCDIYKNSEDIADLRDLSMILVGYAGFLRFDEISELKCSDVNFQDSFLVLKIRKSKTDMYRQGDEVLISKGSSSACPYEMLKKYMVISNHKIASDQYLFKPVNRSKGICKLLKTNKKLSYTRARECILTKLKAVAPTLNLGIHSLRASGASMAANAEGVNERCLKRHGRWKTDTAKDGYIKDSLDKRLEITKCLNL